MRFTVGQHQPGRRGPVRPTEAVATRGSISETFGRPTTPAAVQQGQPLTLVVPAGADVSSVVNREPLGQVPTAASTAYHFDKDNVSVTIPTNQLAPGVYGAWLRHGMEPPYIAPMMASILPHPLVDAANPGVEIVGAAVSGGNSVNVSLREGSNPIVRYCFTVRRFRGRQTGSASSRPAHRVTK